MQVQNECPFWAGSGQPRGSGNRLEAGQNEKQGAAPPQGGFVHEPKVSDAAFTTNGCFDAPGAIRCKDRHHLRTAHADGESL